MTTGKTIALTRQNFVGKVMSLLFNMLSRLVITSFQGVSFNFMAAVTICSDFGAPQNSLTLFSPSICQEVMELVTLISHASKVMLKILQARIQQYVNCELPDVQTGFRKVEEPEIRFPTSAGSSKKQENSRKISISAILTMPKPLTVWITINCGKFFKRWDYQTTWPVCWEICMQVRKQQVELDMEQQTGSK